jgi:hypothetical protein
MTTDTDTDAITRKINTTIKRINRLLDDLGPWQMQSVALADLVGMWLGGIFIFRNADKVIDTNATDKTRRELFAEWCDDVRERMQIHSDALAGSHSVKRDCN